MKLFKVFVYGTLKVGFFNYNALSLGTSTRLIGSAITAEPFPFLILTPFRIPFLLDAPGKGARVEGEILEVDVETLRQLDELEGHPDFYQRRFLDVLLDSKPETVYSYLMPDHRVSSVLVGEESLRSTLTDYTDEDHGLYVPPNKRPPGARSIIMETLRRTGN